MVVTWERVLQVLCRGWKRLSLMAFFHHDYLSPRMLKGLAAYKYKAGGYTWLDDLHNPMWNWIVENWFPVWLAPNLVTLSGLMFIIASYIMLALYAPDLDGRDAPKWVHLFAGFSLVAYVNLDCMDGKQARRTRTSSPLGQLFDHGCDALSVMLILVSASTSACLKLSPVMVVMMGGPLTTWILAQWEEYHTGMMTYGNGYFGILEANYGLAVVHFVSGILGPHVWQYPLSTVAELPQPMANVSFVDAAFALALVFMFIQMAGQVYRVFMFKEAMDAQEKGHKELGALKAVEHLLYIAAVFCLSFMFLTQNKADHPFFDRGLLLCVTITYTMLATQLIMAHMAKESFQPKIRLYLLGLTLGVVNSLLDVIDPVPLLFCLSAAFVSFYVHYVVNVCNQVCDHLGIQCLTIPSQKNL